MTSPARGFPTTRKLFLPPEIQRVYQAFALVPIEVGGDLLPAVDPVTKECSLTLRTLVHGTGLEHNAEDVAKYQHGMPAGAGAVTAVASVELYEQVFQSHTVCSEPFDCNIFWHSHPLAFSLVAMPSAGDYFAHTFLGNYRNAVEHGMLNTMYVCAFEGLYRYDITPAKFAALCEHVGRLKRERSGEVAEQARVDTKELPQSIVDDLSKRVHTELNAASRRSFTEMHRMFDNDDRANTRGAPKLTPDIWKCRKRAECVPEFTFRHAVALRTDPDYQRKVQHFVNRNSYTDHLRQLGYVLEYYPWNLDTGSFINVNVTESLTTPGHASAAPSPG